MASSVSKNLYKSLKISNQVECPKSGMSRSNSKKSHLDVQTLNCPRALVQWGKAYVPSAAGAPLTNSQLSLWVSVCTRFGIRFLEVSAVTMEYFTNVFLPAPQGSER